MASFNRGESFRQPGDARSEVGRSSVAGSMLSDMERLMMLKRQVGADNASETSSQEERKFANLLGAEEEGGGFAGTEMEAPSVGRPANIGQRLYEEGCKRQRSKEELLQAERDRVLMEEMRQMTQRPNITGRARTKPAKGVFFSDHAMVWQQQKQENCRNLERQVKYERMRENTHTPRLNGRSVQLLEEGDYRGPISGWDSHFAKFCAKRSVAVPHGEFTPNINANAVRVDVERNITERLFEDSCIRREKLRDLASQQQQKEMYDPNTGRPLFEPQSLRPPASEGGAAKRRTTEELAQYLHGTGEEIKKRKEHLKEKLADPELTFSPKLSKRSSQLSERVRKPLYTPRTNKDDDNVVANLADKDNKDGKPQPSANKVDVKEFLRRAQRAENVRRRRLEEMREMNSVRAEENCTFHPLINRTSEEIFLHTNMYGVDLENPAAVIMAQHQQQPQPQPQQQPMRQLRFSESQPASTMKSPHHQSPPQHVDPLLGMSAERRGRIQQQQTQPQPQQQRRAPLAQQSPFATSPPPVPPPQAQSQQQQQPHGIAPVDEYINTFEKQMYAVLDEWRKLEDV